MKPFIFFLLLLPNDLLCQSIVLNSNFEYSDTCPKGFNQKHRSINEPIGLDNWVSYHSADYFDITCTKTVYHYRRQGLHEPKSGNGYMGFILKSTKRDRDEYAVGELNATLEKGKKYYIEFYCFRPDYGSYLVNNVSCTFSDTLLKDYRIDKLDAQLVNRVVLNFQITKNDDSVWTKHSASFIAKGDEKYITFGNLLNRKELKKVVERRFVGGMTYIYMDCLTLIEYPDSSNNAPPPSFADTLSYTEIDTILLKKIQPVFSDYIKQHPLQKFKVELELIGKNNKAICLNLIKDKINSDPFLSDHIFLGDENYRFIIDNGAETEYAKKNKLKKMNGIILRILPIDE
jgi:hypothetical protein